MSAASRSELKIPISLFSYFIWGGVPWSPLTAVLLSVKALHTSHQCETSLFGDERVQRKLISFSLRHEDLISTRCHFHNMGISLFLRSGGARLTHKEPVSAQLIVIHQPPHVFCSLFSAASAPTVSKGLAGTCVAAGPY